MRSSWINLPGTVRRQGTIASRVWGIALGGALITALLALVLHNDAWTVIPTASAGTAAVNPAAVDQSKILESYGQLPLSFEPNAGQTDARVKFLSRGPGYTVFLTGNDAVLALAAGAKNKANTSAAGSALPFLGFRDLSTPRPEPQKTSAVLRMHLIGANPHSQVAGMDQLPGTTNYFLGKDSHSWRTGVETYRKVSYQNVYPGIDLVYYGNQRQLEYDFVVAPGSDPAAIKVSMAGASKMHLDAETGDLILGPPPATFTSINRWPINWNPLASPRPISRRPTSTRASYSMRQTASLSSLVPTTTAKR
jgi:hypothetical protein